MQRRLSLDEPATMDATSLSSIEQTCLEAPSPSDILAAASIAPFLSTASQFEPSPSLLSSNESQYFANPLYSSVASSHTHTTAFDHPPELLDLAFDHPFDPHFDTDFSSHFDAHFPSYFLEHEHEHGQAGQEQGIPDPGIGAVKEEEASPANHHRPRSLPKRSTPPSPTTQSSGSPASKRRSSLASPAASGSLSGDQRIRNRAAAQRSRVKRSAENSQLVTDERELAQQRRELQDAVDGLENEAFALKNMLLQHKDCNCDLIRLYFRRRAEAKGKDKR